MQIERMPGHYVEEIAGLDIGTFPSNQKDFAVELFGPAFASLPRDNPDELNEKLDRAKYYLQHPARRALHWALGMGIALGGMAPSVLAGAWIRLHSGQKMIYKLPVALFDQGVTLIPKFQTMREGAFEEIESPFARATFVAHLKNDPDWEDKRILKMVPGITKIRKAGLDEWPQAILVALLKEELVGVRHFDLEELKGVAMMSLMTDKQFDQAEIDEEMRWAYRVYPEMTKRIRPNPAGVNVRSAMSNGKYKVSHAGRIYGDIQFMLNASPRLEMAMAIALVRGRSARAVWQGMKNLVRSM